MLESVIASANPWQGHTADAIIDLPTKPMLQRGHRACMFVYGFLPRVRTVPVYSIGHLSMYRPTVAHAGGRTIDVVSVIVGRIFSLAWAILDGKDIVENLSTSD